MLRSLTIVVMSLFASLGARAENAYFFSATNLSSDRYHGNQFELNGLTDVSDASKIGLGVTTVSRRYAGDVKIDDVLASIAGSHNFGSGRYVEAHAGFGFNPVILPRADISVDPHQVIGNTDFGLGLQHRTYANVVAGTLHPNVRQEFGDNIAVTGGAFVTRAQSTLMALNLSAAVKLAEQTTFQLGAASGQGLEDAGVTAQFVSYNFGCAVRGQSETFGRRVTVGADVMRYRSDLRDETSIGVRVELR